jgi:hypothetical protein
MELGLEHRISQQGERRQTNGAKQYLDRWMKSAEDGGATFNLKDNVAAGTKQHLRIERGWLLAPMCVTRTCVPVRS